MPPLTQEDSLVFADEAKWLEKTLIPPDPPDTSAIFHSPNLPSDSTQIDQSTSPVFRHRSYSSSSNSNSISPVITADRLHLLGEPTFQEDTRPLLTDVHELRSATTETTLKQIPALGFPFLHGSLTTRVPEATQVIGGLRRPSIETSETQVVRRRSDSGIDEELDQVKGSGTHSCDDRADGIFPLSGSPVRFHSDTQVIGRSRRNFKHSEPVKSDNPTVSSGPLLLSDTHMTGADTQIIGQIAQHTEDTQVLPRDTQVLPRAGPGPLQYTQITPQNTQTMLEDNYILPLDTQVIPQHANNKEQDIASLHGDTSDTLTKPTQVDGNASNLKLDASPLITEIHKVTEIISENGLSLPTNILLDNTNESHTKEYLQDSPQRDEDYDQNDVNTTLHSIEWGDTQPITQVVNFQPAQLNHLNMESSPTKTFDFEVDTTTLVLSPADQNRLHEEPTTQVVNTQEELMEHNELNSVGVGRKSVFSSSQNERIVNQNLSIISNDDYTKDDIDNSILYEDSVITHRRKRQKLLAAQDAIASNEIEVNKRNSSINEEILSESQDNTSKVKDGFSSGTSSIPTSAPLPQKNNWSQSSSELEDFSHDVGFDVDMMGSSSDKILQQAEESHVEIVAPRKRRTNQIPETQSQPKEFLEETLTLLSTDSICNQQAVWVISQFKHHPGRVLSLGEGISLVEFSDFILKEIKNEDLYLLDLRIGDVVLLKLRLGEFIVTGLVCLYDESYFKCMRGFDTVIVTKKGRHGYSQGKGFQVAISQIYMEMGMWAEHQQRYQLFYGDTDLSQENYATVCGKINATKCGVPNHLSKLDEKVAPLTLLQPQTIDSRDAPKQSNLFSKMVFFVTSVNDTRKAELSHLISSNGGIFIDDEIKLFVTNGTSADNDLCLKLNQFEGLRFGALLSDGCSRSAKYLQALALGWPILADSFVDEAIANPNILDNWSVYLLPSGHSLHIKGLRSNDIFKFRENYSRDVDLNKQLSNNSGLLASEVIIILDKKQDPKTLDMCEFIFHAFGAKAIKFCKTLNGVDKLLKEMRDQNVMVYDNGSNEYVKAGPRKLLKKTASRLNVGVIGWEWLVQCVISCYIWQPDYRVSV